MHRLVIQAPNIATQDLKQLARLSDAYQIDAINQQAFRLLGAHIDNDEAVADFCESNQLDYAFIPEDANVHDIGLVVMDMDSTLITIECIDEIADMVGIKPQVADITAAAMRGELDFRESLTRRVALLAGLEESALARVYDERLQLMAGAEKMLKGFQQAGAKTLLISGGFTFFTGKLQTRLSLSRAIANVLEIDNGKLTGKVNGDIVDAERKKTELIAFREELGLRRDQVVAIGDGANDLPMLHEAGYGVACHAKPKVKAEAPYSINQVGLEGVLNYFL
ncbi:phosphoserine phosphatase [Andreprevotia lacus DSM 23236]|jgi:phosphoserine phosphatase|uniref:Phosphoserine phosphatase n=1 Tax=Andreprevotia lacus DSM 23236 TaxID=1121001 RepID=A0A1W1XLK8_9NEIS|nr:phosphoserine phosphatase SerB [Andreprevotia lacus]SMC24869.1 phosphoserine phosphatase [Andreprevotia lacus DSM 23236]